MRATLSYSLPEEADEHQTALDGHRWRAAVEELDEVLRRSEKHGDEPSATHAAWAREILRRVLDERGLL